MNYPFNEMESRVRQSALWDIVFQRPGCIINIIIWPHSIGCISSMSSIVVRHTPSIWSGVDSVKSSYLLFPSCNVDLISTFNFDWNNWSSCSCELPSEVFWICSSESRCLPQHLRCLFQVKTTHMCYISERKVVISGQLMSYLPSYFVIKIGSVG